MIKYLLLGYLNWQPRTGIELKKIVAHSEILDLPQNNNHVYSGLVQLLDAEWVEKSATKPAVFTITDQGKTALQQWVQQSPEPPESKKTFFWQLMWSDMVNAHELDQLLAAYSKEVSNKLFMMRVQADEKPDTPNRTEREAYLWEMVRKNHITHFELELNWIRQLRDDLNQLEAKRQRQLARQKK